MTEDGLNPSEYTTSGAANALFGVDKMPADKRPLTPKTLKNFAFMFSPFRLLLKVSPVLCCLSSGQALQQPHESHATSTTTGILDAVAIATVWQQAQTIDREVDANPAACRMHGWIWSRFRDSRQIPAILGDR